MTHQPRERDVKARAGSGKQPLIESNPVIAAGVVLAVLAFSLAVFADGAPALESQARDGAIRPVEGAGDLGP